MGGDAQGFTPDAAVVAGRVEGLERDSVEEKAGGHSLGGGGVGSDIHLNDNILIEFKLKQAFSVGFSEF